MYYNVFCGEQIISVPNDKEVITLKNRIVAAVMASLIVVLSACGSSGTVTPAQDNTSSNTAEVNKEDSNKSQTSEMEEEHKSIEVDENLLTVEITVPADFIGDVTQEDIDKNVKEKGFISGKLNSDGSVTYKMTKGQHKELMAQIKENIDTQLKEMIESEDYPNFVNIEANDDYTNFTITTKSTELGLMESMSTLMFYMCGGMYAAFSGDKVENIHVDFVNADSGEVIQSADSKNMGSGN